MQQRWWEKAASDGGNANCGNCGFSFFHPFRGLVRCRLRNHFPPCCLDWRDKETNQSPYDEVLRQKVLMRRQHAALERARANGDSRGAYYILQSEGLL
jgi:hypothetical protein